MSRLPQHFMMSHAISQCNRFIIWDNRRAISQTFARIITVCRKRRLKMLQHIYRLRAILILAAAILCRMLNPTTAIAHCDTLDGPVVQEAKIALAIGDVTPVLKWVQPEHDAEIRGAFQKTLRVRSKGEEARDLADHYFFETLVRLHREGEGEPYTGLKPAGTPLDPAIDQSDKAVAAGSVDELEKWLSKAVTVGLRTRFASVRDKKQHAQESVKAGREYVAAYVDFMHYVERLHTTMIATSAHAASSHEHASEAVQHKQQEASSARSSSERIR